ncbi:MAG: MBL fold metallo-hydrolase [Candidatus Hydrogenedentes bacterium]|nr:MBL fold metallo-hydrolase [Candidatus Hydrogenedentota bacterium]
MQENSFKVTILYNNVPHDKRLTTAWGMACLVEGGPKTVLFDTGGDGSILLENMKTLEKNPDDVDVVVISHIHADHTGGLAAFLEENSNVEVFLPASFPASLKEETARTGAEVQEVSGPRRIVEGIHTTGEMGTFLKEQALILDTAKGLVLITGCSHPGVDNMAQQAVKVCPDRIFYLITGGFHLGGKSAASIQKIIRTFRTLEVQKVGPSHCTGDNAIRMFKEAWGEDFVDLGCGDQATIPRKREQTEGTKR